MYASMYIYILHWWLPGHQANQIHKCMYTIYTCVHIYNPRYIRERPNEFSLRNTNGLWEFLRVQGYMYYILLHHHYHHQQHQQTTRSYLNYNSQRNALKNYMYVYIYWIVNTLVLKISSRSLSLCKTIYSQL